MIYEYKDSPECLRLLSIVRDLEKRSASPSEVDAAMDVYYEQKDKDHKNTVECIKKVWEQLSKESESKNDS